MTLLDRQWLPSEESTDALRGQEPARFVPVRQAADAQDFVIGPNRRTLIATGLAGCQSYFADTAEAAAGISGALGSFEICHSTRFRPIATARVLVTPGCMLRASVLYVPGAMAGAFATEVTGDDAAEGAFFAQNGGAIVWVVDWGGGMPTTTTIVPLPRGLATGYRVIVTDPILPVELEDFSHPVSIEATCYLRGGARVLSSELFEEPIDLKDGDPNICFLAQRFAEEYPTTTSVARAVSVVEAQATYAKPTLLDYSPWHDELTEAWYGWYDPESVDYLDALTDPLPNYALDLDPLNGPVEYGEAFTGSDWVRVGGGLGDAYDDTDAGWSIAPAALSRAFDPDEGQDAAVPVIVHVRSRGDAAELRVWAAEDSYVDVTLGAAATPGWSTGYGYLRCGLPGVGDPSVVQMFVRGGDVEILAINVVRA